MGECLCLGFGYEDPQLTVQDVYICTEPVGFFGPWAKCVACGCGYPSSGLFGKMYASLAIRFFCGAVPGIDVTGQGLGRWKIRGCHGYSPHTDDVAIECFVAVEQMVYGPSCSFLCFLRMIYTDG